jgi:signal transduction histidine kinase
MAGSGMLEATDGWRGLLGSLIRGIGHDLNGRLTALMGVAHLARSAGSLDPELLSVLDDQIGRLNESVAMLRSVPFDTSGDAQLTRIVDIVPPVTELYRCRAGADFATLTIGGDSGAPPLEVSIDRLSGALLLLLAAAERGPGGHARSLGVRFGHEGSNVWVRVESCSEPRQGGDELSWDPECAEGVAEARSLVEQDGGTLSTRAEPSDDGFRVSLEARYAAVTID